MRALSLTSESSLPDGIDFRLGFTVDGQFVVGLQGEDQIGHRHASVGIKGFDAAAVHEEAQLLETAVGGCGGDGCK